MRQYIEKFKKYKRIVLAVVIVLGCYVWTMRMYDNRNEDSILKNVAASVGESGKFIVVDGGHGFFDAGKLGINGAEEKEINLSIACKLRNVLKEQGYAVRMTRENDDCLYDGSRPKTKKEDMRKRIELINDMNCILAVSIHENSFSKAQYKGAQTFYYSGSEEGQSLATSIQKSLRARLDPDNERKEKANSEYYLLKKAKVPMVICECGFLSNYDEAELLITDEYQEKAAWAVAIGILQYMNGR